MMTWWCDDMMMWWYDDIMTWWFDELAISWYEDMMMWWLDHVVIRTWWDDDMMVRWVMIWCHDNMMPSPYDDTGHDDIISWGYDDMVKQWYDYTMINTLSLLVIHSVRQDTFSRSVRSSSSRAQTAYQSFFLKITQAKQTKHF